MKWCIAIALLATACAGDDDDDTVGESSANDTNIPDGGPCGIAGGPLPQDELHTPLVGVDPTGKPAVLVELHEAGTCTGEPPTATTAVVYDVATNTIAFVTPPPEITMPADYHDEHYWWDPLAVDLAMVSTTDGVMLTFHHDPDNAVATCTPGETTVDCVAAPGG